MWSKICPLCSLWGGFQTIHWQRRVFRNHGLGNCLSRILRHLFIIIYVYYRVFIYISFDCHACSTRLYISVFRLKTLNVGLPFALCPGGLPPNWQISMQNNGDKPHLFFGMHDLPFMYAWSLLVDGSSSSCTIYIYIYVSYINVYQYIMT